MRTATKSMNLISLPLFCRATMPLIFMEKMSCLLAKNFITYVRVHFYFFKLIFTFLASSISHFLTAAVKFSCFSSNEVLLLCFQSLAQALIKITPKKTRLCGCFFCLRVPVTTRFPAKNTSSCVWCHTCTS